eukprot:scaffold638_cov382-Prasinococcus_capsulatus_cf.AAC.15
MDKLIKEHKRMLEDGPGPNQKKWSHGTDALCLQRDNRGGGISEVYPNGAAVREGCYATPRHHGQGNTSTHYGTLSRTQTQPTRGDPPAMEVRHEPGDAGLVLPSTSSCQTNDDGAEMAPLADLWCDDPGDFVMGASVVREGRSITLLAR